MRGPHRHLQIPEDLHRIPNAFGRVSNFGTYLRLVGEVPEGGQMRVIVYLAMKS